MASPTYPATDFTEGTELFLYDVNQIHEVINSDAETAITVDDGTIPSLRKSIVDNFYFLDPIDWEEGTDITVFNQLVLFTNGILYYAPLATPTNPITMGTTPEGDSNFSMSVYSATDTSVEAFATAAATSATEAEGFRDESEGFRDEVLSVNTVATSAADAASASATTASNSETSVLASEANVVALEASTETFASEAEESKNTILASLSSYEVTTTEYLINSLDTSTLNTGDIVKSLGYSVKGGYGSSSWVKTGVTGSVSQTPLQMGSYALTSLNGDIFNLVTCETLSVEELGTPSPQLIKIAVSSANGSNISTVSCITDFEVSETVEIVGSNLYINMDCNITSSASLDDSVVTIHSSDNLTLRFKSVLGNREDVGDSISGLNGVTVTNSSYITVHDSDVGSTSNHSIIFTENSEGGVSGIAMENLGAVSYCKSIDNHTFDTGNGAIVFQSGSYGWAVRNICDTFGNEGIQMIDGWDTGVILDNKVSANESTAIILEQHSGRGVTSAVRNIIISNNMIDSYWHGIGIEHKASGFENIVIKGNTINLLNETTLTLAGVAVTNSGVMIDRITISDNIIKGVSTQRLRDGILFFNQGDDSGYADSAVITNNTLEDLRYGISFAGGDYSDNSIITGNRIKASTIAIQVYDRSAYVISSNTMEQCNGVFIKVGTTLSGNNRGGIISGNTMRYANSALTAGILVEAGVGGITHYQIKGNFVDVSGGSSATAILDEINDVDSETSGNITR